MEELLKLTNMDGAKKDYWRIVYEYEKNMFSNRQ